MAGENKLPMPESQREDEQIILRCRKDDSMAAFGLLVEKYQDRVFNAALRMVGNHDDALDLTQEAFCRALRSLSRFRGGSVFYTWMFRITMNLCIDFRVKRRRLRVAGDFAEPDVSESQAGTLFDMMESREPGPAVAAQAKEKRERILAAIESLDPQDRAIVVLREVEQLDYKQISKVLEVPVGTVKSRLARARLKLRTKLG